MVATIKEKDQQQYNNSINLFSQKKSSFQEQDGVILRQKIEYRIVDGKETPETFDRIEKEL